MATKKKQKTSKGPMIGLLAIGAIGLAVLAAYVKFGGADKVPTEVKRVPAIQQPASNKNKPDQVTLITPTREGTDLNLGKHQSDVPTGENPMLFALNHFLRESKIVPDDARAVGMQVKDHVALVDVSPSFNQSYGSMDEETLLKGICATLAQFPEVEKVQFFVEGKVVGSLGNVDLSEPISVRPKTENP